MRVVFDMANRRRQGQMLWIGREMDGRRKGEDTVSRAITMHHKTQGSNKVKRK